MLLLPKTQAAAETLTRSSGCCCVKQQECLRMAWRPCGSTFPAKLRDHPRSSQVSHGHSACSCEASQLHCCAVPKIWRIEVSLLYGTSHAQAGGQMLTNPLPGVSGCLQLRTPPGSKREAGRAAKTCSASSQGRRWAPHWRVRRTWGRLCGSNLGELDGWRHSSAAGSVTPTEGAAVCPGGRWCLEGEAAAAAAATQEAQTRLEQVPGVRLSWWLQRHANMMPLPTHCCAGAGAFQQPSEAACSLSGSRSNLARAATRASTATAVGQRRQPQPQRE